jgi:hypothetical protein
VTVASDTAKIAIKISWSRPRVPDAHDLAGHQMTGADRRQQHLDDAGGLLLDHPRCDPDAVAEELPVEHQHRRERDGCLRVTVGVGGQDRRRVHRMLILKRLEGVGVRPGVLERVLEPRRDRGGLHDLVEEARHVPEDLEGGDPFADVLVPADQHSIHAPVTQRALDGTLIAERHDPEVDAGPFRDRRGAVRDRPVADDREVEGVRTAGVGAQEDEDRQDDDRDRGGDREPLVTEAHGEVAGGYHAPHAAVGDGGIVAHDATTSRNSSDNVGRT